MIKSQKQDTNSKYKLATCSPFEFVFGFFSKFWYLGGLDPKYTLPTFGDRGDISPGSGEREGRGDISGSLSKRVGIVCVCILVCKAGYEYVCTGVGL